MIPHSDQDILRKNFKLLIKAGRWIELHPQRPKEIADLKNRAQGVIEECVKAGATELFCWCLIEFPVEVKAYLWEQFEEGYEEMMRGGEDN